MSVRETEKKAKNLQNMPKEIVSRETHKLKDDKIEELQEILIKTIGSKVEIKGNQKKGKIEIHYFSKEELENIYRLISPKQ